MVFNNWFCVLYSIKVLELCMFVLIVILLLVGLGKVLIIVVFLKVAIFLNEVGIEL